jgi:hypothetical protein
MAANRSSAMMSRTAWAVFIVIQIVGLICVLISAWASAYEVFSISPAIYAAAMFLLLPGDFISGLIVENLLWTKLALANWLTSRQIGLIELLMGVAINLCVWLLCAKLMRFIKRTRVRSTDS